MRSLALLLAISLSGCVSNPSHNPVQSLHTEVLGLFTPVRQDGDILRVHSGTEEFSGDCDDYYTAVRSRLRELGALTLTVLGVEPKSKEGHIMACTLHSREGILCLDPNYRVVSDWVTVRRRYEDVKITRELEEL